MKIKVLIVDPLSERGHLQFNSLIVDALRGIDFRLVLASGVYGEQFPNSRRFPRLLLNKFPGIYQALQIIILVALIVFGRILGYRRILLLSYSIASMVVASHLAHLLGVRVYVFEHNTTPPFDRAIKRTLFLTISRHTVHICLTPVGARYLRSKYNKKAFYVRHPIISSEGTASTPQSKCYPSFIFAPSGSNDISVINDCSKLSELKIVAKTKLPVEAPNVDSRSHFPNYYELLSTASAIWLPFKMRNRVSGVFYEAVAYGKPIFISRSLFARVAKKQFPEHPIVITDCPVFKAVKFPAPRLMAGAVHIYQDLHRAELLRALGIEE